MLQKLGYTGVEVVTKSQGEIRAKSLLGCQHGYVFHHGPVYKLLTINDHWPEGPPDRHGGPQSLHHVPFGKDLGLAAGEIRGHHP